MQRRWNLNLMGNFYQYRVEGEVFGETFDWESVNWSARMNNNIKLSKNLACINSRANHVWAEDPHNEDKWHNEDSTDHSSNINVGRVKPQP